MSTFNLIFGGLGWNGLVQALPLFGGEDPIAGPWHHEHITLEAAARAGWSTSEGVDLRGKPDRSSAAAALAWHADYVDSYLYNPLWWTPGGLPRFRAALLAHDHLVNVHFDDLTSTRQIEIMWNRYLSGTVVGLLWAANRDDVAAARHVVGVGLHAAQDFYSHSNWVDAPERRRHTWFQYKLKDNVGLYTGTYEIPDHLGVKPHGKPAFDCKVMKDFVGSKLMNAVCSGFSPLSNSSLCRRWNDCQNAQTARPPSVAGVEIPEGLWMVDPGIALDSTWQADIGVTQRDLPDKGAITGSDLWEAARSLAVEHSVQWLLILERVMDRQGLHAFWNEVKSEPRQDLRKFEVAPELTHYIAGFGPDLNQYERSDRLLYTFLSTGDYPPSVDSTEKWYLRLEIMTSAEEGAGTDADISAAIGGDQFLLDHMHDRKPGGGLDEMRLLEHNDFERGARTSYVLGPFQNLPDKLVLKNSAATLWDVVEGLFRDLVAKVNDFVDGIDDFLLSLIAGHADVVDGTKGSWTWGDLESIRDGRDGRFAFRCRRGDEGDFEITGHLEVSDEGAGLHVNIRFEHLHCIKESKNDRGSDSDETFILLMASSPASPDPIDKGIAGPYADVDTGEYRDINVTLTRHVPVGGGLIIPIMVMESDDEGETKRQELLENFASRYGDATINQRSLFLDALGRAIQPDWRFERINIFAFRRADPIEFVTFLPQTAGMWIRAGESQILELQPHIVQSAELRHFGTVAPLLPILVEGTVAPSPVFIPAVVAPTLVQP